MTSLTHGLFASLLVLAWLLPVCQSHASDSLEGAWIDAQDSSYAVGIQGDRFTVSSGGQVRVISRIIERDSKRLHLCEKGRDVVLAVSREGKGLSVQNLNSGENRRLVLTPEWPPVLVLRPLELRPPTPVTQERVLEIQGELWGRFAVDQEAMRPPAMPRGRGGDELPWLPRSVPMLRELSIRDLNLLAVQADNTAFIKRLLAEVGWVDVTRFGYPASDAAFLLVQHSYDLPLMTAVLEAIRRDVEAGHPMGEPYALLYDRVHLMTGDRQRYGTQVDYDETGTPMLQPVEEPGTLDERRRALGMMPIRDYLKIFGADQVRISSACSPSAEQR